MGKGFLSFSKGGWRKFWKAVKEADIIVEVLDSRDPEGFRIKSIEEKLTELGKKIILVINKADLVPREILEEWKNFLSKEHPTLYISARYRKGTGMLRKLILKVAGKKDLVKVAVVGYPNVGKSTIINILKGSHSAPTGALPGVTRHLQVLRRGRIRIIDTPGVFPIEDELSLIYKGSIRVENLDDPINSCSELLKKILEIDKDAIKRAYGIKSIEPLEIIELFAEKRKRYKKGGELDLETAARMIIKDWLDGKITIWRRPPIERD